MDTAVKFNVYARWIQLPTPS